MAHVQLSRPRKGSLEGLPSWDDPITFACAICASEITVKYHGRAPSAFCRSCTGRLARLKKQWGYRHGQSGSPLYNCWSNMRSRCNRPTHACFKDYGARGIRVAAIWDLSFQAFYEWSIANGWQKGLTLDRRDNNGPYSPENCRWVTNQVNTQNTRLVKLTPEDVADIKAMILAGRSYVEINAVHPLTPRNFRAIKHREHWTNIVPSAAA